MPLPTAYSSCYFCHKTLSAKTSPSIFKLSNHIRLHTKESPFTCPFPDICRMSFKTQKKLTVHKSQHENGGQKPWKCDQCEGSFKTKSALASHVIDMHTTERPFKCTLCPASYKRVTLLKLHLKDHDPFNRYSCTNCELLFKTEKTLKSHLVNKHGGRDWKCYFCKKTFTQVGLIHHIRIHTEEAVFKCRTCPRAFLHYSTRFQHEEKEHGERRDEPGLPTWKCKFCPNAYIKKQGLLYHLGNKHGETDLLPPSLRGKECPLCHKICKDTNSLSVHTRIHTGEKPYTCPRPDCGKQFSTSSSLKGHSKYHANNPGGQFKCRFCPKSFQTPKRAKYHESNVHPETWARPKKCSSCPKLYPSYSSLARHELIHLKEPSFQCAHCPKAFFRQSEYSKHMKRFHEMEKIKNEVKQKENFTCKICSKEFPNFGKFANHQELHLVGNHQCPKCPLNFQNVHLLRKHEIRFHSGPKYKCYFCLKIPRWFNTPGNLRDHVITHTQEYERFGCPNCEKSFKRRPNLKHHMEVCCPTRKINSADFLCDKCPEKTFYSKHQLYTHTYRAHTKTWKRKPCPFCGHIARDNYALALHLRTHVGEKPYTCATCGMRFTQKTTYSVHLRRHDDRKNGVKFPCKICNKHFSTTDSLAGHTRRFHSGREIKNTCYFCPVIVTRKESLEYHMRIRHTFEKVISCGECPTRRFLTTTGLNYHRLKQHPYLFRKLNFDLVTPKVSKIEFDLVTPQSFGN
ncbi:Zinc finger protein 26 [Folsomia candida]|uniref:Zinc finger protein 26 n=1 Tax=Folsomia candida TaxID=158441 RepID=A0A226CY59_FOLCA|nr:Zinc finger protein 26 [Folsomia candida]